MKIRLLMLLVIVSLMCVVGSTSFADEEEPFSRFIKPMTNPVYFDEAANRTYLHVVYIYQTLPNHVKTNLGRVPLDGALQSTSVRINYAINERFSLIAAKDAYIDFSPDRTLNDRSGYGDIAAGLKYAFLYDPEDEFILSGKVLFEFSNGSRDVFQGNGDGHAAPSLTFLKGYDNLQFTGTLGFQIPFNHNEESTMLYNSWHVSYAIAECVFPLLELNWWRTLRRGHLNGLRSQVPGATTRFEGGDLINFGSRKALSHRDLVTMAAGLRYRPLKNLGFLHDMDLGFAFEWPLTPQNQSLMAMRFGFDVMFHF